jgi:hypothetical protein
MIGGDCLFRIYLTIIALQILQHIPVIAIQSTSLMGGQCLGAGPCHF